MAREAVGKARKPRARRRRFEVYYKVEVRDRVSMVWRDKRKASFSSLEEAAAYCRAFEPEELRIVKYSEDGITVEYKNDMQRS